MNDRNRSDLDGSMPGSGLGLDRSLDRDFTADEARRALAGEPLDGSATEDEDEDAGTDAEDLGIDVSVDLQTNSGGDGSSD